MFLPMTPPLGLNRFLDKGHAVELQKADSLRIVLGGSRDGYLQAANFIYLVIVNFWKNTLLPYTDTEVTAAVESPPR